MTLYNPTHHTLPPHHTTTTTQLGLASDPRPSAARRRVRRLHLRGSFQRLPLGAVGPHAAVPHAASHAGHATAKELLYDEPNHRRLLVSIVSSLYPLFLALL